MGASHGFGFFVVQASILKSKDTVSTGFSRRTLCTIVRPMPDSWEISLSVFNRPMCAI